MKSTARNVPDWRDVVAGASAGAFSKTVMAPIERVKLLLQLQGSVQGSVGGTTAYQVAWHIYREEGILAFWRGNLPNCLRTAGQAALNFALMDYYKTVAVSPFLAGTIIQRRTTSLQQIERRRQFMASFISGGMAGGTATTVLYPVEFLRTRLAMDQGRSVETRKYRGMRHVLTSTLRADGLRGLYQGYGIAVSGGILFRLLYLGGYDAIKTEWQIYKRQTGGNDSLDWTERFAAAEMISLTAGTICYPIDSVRRRMMMQAGEPKEKRLYIGSIHCFRVIWAQEGLRGFFLGIAPNMVRSIGGALMLVAYDLFKVIL
jgi:solute carrier family 25 (adenine nucleotide translocator) protein 4/5/6/31